MRKVLMALALMTVSACAATPPNPPANPPRSGFPPDTKLICYAEQWAIVSPSLELAGVFDIPCGPNV